ncbi:MAG: hypothetical protein ACYC5W_16085 [Thauera sp.]
MKVEIMALRKAGDLARALDLLSTEGAYEVHTARGGNPLAGKCQAPTLVIDRLESIVAPDLDVIRLAVNAIESQGYERVVFIAGLDRHGSFSKPVQRSIAAIERDIRVRKILGTAAVHHDTLECPPSLFVETGFRRADQPVFVLAMLESGRRLSVPPELRDHLERITEMVVEHYQAHHGELVLWGKIDHYGYHDGRGRVHRISPDGRLLDESGAARGGFEGRAELSVGVVF